MPVFDGADYLAAAIASVLQQTYTHFELIVVDDGSTDASADIVRGLPDSRISLIVLDHGGAGRARNAGIAKSRGRYIAFMDADDIALPDRLEVQLAYIQRTGVEICGGCAKEFGAASRVYWCPETHQTIVNDLLFRCALLVPAIVMRADIARENPFDERSMAEDYELWTRLALRYRMANVQQVLFKYRSHKKQRHVSGRHEFASEMRRIRTRYFQALFPEADSEEYAAFERAVENGAARNLVDLERTGHWLVRLADVRDKFFRDFLGRRWLHSCRLAAPLGHGAYRIYRQYAPQFGPVSAGRKLRLEMICALRLGPRRASVSPAV